MHTKMTNKHLFQNQKNIEFETIVEIHTNVRRYSKQTTELFKNRSKRVLEEKYFPTDKSCLLFKTLHYEKKYNCLVRKVIGIEQYIF